MKTEKTLSIVTVGHVDHGKSTILGRLLADTGSLGKGKLEQVKASCQKNSKPFEYAFLLDALKDEQSQGITIDAARVFFKTSKRNYLFIDAPGHIEFLRNMVTGASRADAALLVIDIDEGIQNNSRRHAFLLSMLGVKNVAVIVNKMDLVSYNKEKFNEIVSKYKEFLYSINIEPLAFVPASGMKGDNVVNRTDNISWHKGQTVLGVIESFSSQESSLDKPFRMPVQDVYKFTNFNDKRRIVAGTVLSGRVSVGDEVFFYPSGKKSVVKTIEAFNKPVQSQAITGEATGITLTEQLYIKRGEIVVGSQGLQPKVTSCLCASIFWLSKNPMQKKKEYILKLGSMKVVAEIEVIHKTIDTSGLTEVSSKDAIERNYMSECTLKLASPIAFDLIDNFQDTARFVIVDNYQISGGGIILKALEDKDSWVRDKVLVRDHKWIKSLIPHSLRKEKYKQSSALILITGQKDSGRKSLAKSLEKSLFDQGHFVYFFGLGNILYGVDADIKGINNHKEEHIRRLSEVCHLMLESGMIVIVTAINLRQADIDIINMAVGSDRTSVVWIGKKVTTDISYDLKIDEVNGTDKPSVIIKNMIKDKGIIRN